MVACVLNVGVRTKPQKQLHHRQIALARRRVQQSAAGVTLLHKRRIIGYSFLDISQQLWVAAAHHLREQARQYRAVALETRS